MRNDGFIERLVRAVERSEEPEAFRQLALEQARRLVRYDTGVFIPFGTAIPIETFAMPVNVLQRYLSAVKSGSVALSPGGATRVVPFLEQYLAFQERYDRDLRKARVYANRNGGAYIDTEVYTARERRELAYFRELVHPQGISSMIVASIAFRGEASGIMQLTRKDGTRFARGHLRALRPLLALVGVLHAQAEAPPAAGSLALDARPEVLNPHERQLVHLVSCGHTNREIAAILGMSPNTVRNHLVLVFVKGGVRTRTELVTWARERWAPIPIALDGQAVHTSQMAAAAHTKPAM